MSIILTKSYNQVKNRHHLAAAAEALVKSGRGAEGRMAKHIKISSQQITSFLAKKILDFFADNENGIGETEDLWGDQGADQSRRTRLDRPVSQLKIG